MTTMLGILQHALGRDQYGKSRRDGEDYRNHYCAGEGCDSLVTCREAVALGLMTEHAAREISGGDPIFVVTGKGKAYIAEHSPAPPKVSRGKARYLRWLGGAGDVGISFGDWLKMGAP